MSRASYLFSILLLAVALPCAAGDKDDIRDALRKAAESQAQKRDAKAEQPEPPRQPELHVQRERSPPQEDRLPQAPVQREQHTSNNAVVRTIADRVIVKSKNPTPQVRVGQTRSRDWDCMSLQDCPLGAPWAATFDELRYSYRHLTDNELWDICLGRGVGFYGYRRDVACLMLSFPNPWRPVALPRRLEHAPAPFPEVSPYEPEIVDETPEESAPPFCEINETLNRKRPTGECRRPTPTLAAE